MNEWCDVNNLKFKWICEYMDEDARDLVDEDIFYKEALAANWTLTVHKTEYESDFQIKTALIVYYNSTHFTSHRRTD